jgi:hypothetical protein
VVLVASRLEANCGTRAHMATKAIAWASTSFTQKGYICTGYRYTVTAKCLVSQDENGVGATVAIVEYATGPVESGESPVGSTGALACSLNDAVLIERQLPMRVAPRRRGRLVTAPFRSLVPSSNGCDSARCTRAGAMRTDSSVAADCGLIVIRALPW